MKMLSIADRQYSKALAASSGALPVDDRKFYDSPSFDVIAEFDVLSLAGFAQVLEEG